MRKLFRRIHAWFAGRHAWYYLGSAGEDEVVVSTPSPMGRRERTLARELAMKERVESGVLHQLRLMSKEERLLRTSDHYIPDTLSVAIMGMPYSERKKIFPQVPERMKPKFAVIPDDL